MSDDSKSVHLLIRGRVQGVFYRAWTKQRADHHGLDGWVRNRDDGAVEVLMSGPGDAVEALVAECRRGPPAARVDDVAVREAEPVASRGFTVSD